MTLTYIIISCEPQRDHIQYAERRKQCTLQKKNCDFPVPSRDVTNQTLPGRE
jgi:hypothetical protein